MLLFVGVIFCRYFVWMLAGGHRREQELELSFECEYYGSALVNQRWSDNSHVAVCSSRLVLSSIISSILSLMKLQYLKSEVDWLNLAPGM